mmetsp:Transcript_16692/g.31236  ORF Transcript_16692/g.31236 Transcript_16692/m.31236 type:complete len:279 (+) Transcript_16692:508-1344(+)
MSVFLPREPNLRRSNLVLRYKLREHPPLEVSRSHLALSLETLGLVRPVPGCVLALSEIRPRRVLVRDHHVKLPVTDLPVAVRIHHCDHHVDFLVRHELAHANQYVPDLGRSDVIVVVQVNELERRPNLLVVESAVVRHLGFVSVVQYVLRQNDISGHGGRVASADDPGLGFLQPLLLGGLDLLEVNPVGVVVGVNVGLVLGERDTVVASEIKHHMDLSGVLQHIVLVFVLESDPSVHVALLEHRQQTDVRLSDQLVRARQHIVIVALHLELVVVDQVH